MSPPGNNNAGPSAEQYAGDGFFRSALRFFHATRPKFFPASVLPVIAGTVWGVAAAGSFDVSAFLLALFATACVHAGANVLNDVGDADGTDRINQGRIYPYTGGSRFIQEGILSAHAMARLGISLITAAAIAGLLLLAAKGMMVFWFGVTGVALAVLYSLGPMRLSSLGLGELAVGLGLGVLPVCGAAWLQSDALDIPALLFALPISAWVANILLINEVPDITADEASGKRTLPVRLGLHATAVIYFAVAVFAAGMCIWLTLDAHLPLLTPLVPLGLLALAARAASAIHGGTDDRERLTGGIEATLAIHTVGSIWLIGCVLYLVLVQPA